MEEEQRPLSRVSRYGQRSISADGSPLASPFLGATQVPELPPPLFAAG